MAATEYGPSGRLVQLLFSELRRLRLENLLHKMTVNIDKRVTTPVVFSNTCDAPRFYRTVGLACIESTSLLIVVDFAYPSGIKWHIGWKFR